MTYEQAKEKLLSFGQEHVLQYYSALSPQEQATLLEQIDRTDFSICRNAERLGAPAQRGVFSPLAAMQREQIDAERKKLGQAGAKLIRAGKVAAVMLAGGMGTRLGSDAPKGMYDIGITHPVYIFQRQIENLLEVVRETGFCVRLFIMTSEKNDRETRSFLASHRYFGYPGDRVTFFTQEMAPVTDYDGRVFMESEGRIATSPNGNAGWFLSMERAGLLPLLREEGTEWLNIFAVDNVLQRIADPVFVGATASAGVEVGAKVIRKNARDEKVGVICLEDGRPSIVEYYELTDEMMDRTDGQGRRVYDYGVILNYLFRRDALERILHRSLPLHVVEKKIPFMAESGERIVPDAPNGVKFEQLALDLIHALDSCLPFEVAREKEFAPIKNRTGVDSVETAQKLCIQAGISL